MRFRFLLIGVLLASAACAADNTSLAGSPSAFVRAQASSGVHWHPWTDVTLAEAKQQHHSVYVFIGSPLSELTRATLAQTFTQPKTVEWLNENFFCIFVDADAQPDVAAYGQHFIRNVKQLQGSPVHLWLTPELRPYDGANYLPPSEEWGKPGYLKAARSALDAWTDPARARALAQEALGMMRVPPLENSTKVDAAAKLESAAKAWVATLDPVNGGFGGAPKQPEPELILFLLTRSDTPSREAALNAARALVKGAAHDPIDGGFYRRCIDEEWKEPYFQKTLADQARVALTLFAAAAVAQDDKLEQAAVGALDFVLKEMRNKDGSFVAALDGTLEATPDSVKRPSFVRVGLASTGALGRLLAALRHSREERHKSAYLELYRKLADEGVTLPHIPGSVAPGDAADYVSVAAAFEEISDHGRSTPLLQRANELYFDATTGSYQASSAHPPAGIALRVPASGDTPSAEVLALLAGVDAKTADLMRRGLMSSIEYDDLPPGDVLLGLGTNR